MSKTNKKFKELYLPAIGAVAVGAATWIGVSQVNDSDFRTPSSDGNYKTAYEAWADLQYSGASYDARALLVDGETLPGMLGGVTFGAEKEASSSLLTRVMSPKTAVVIQQLKKLSQAEREKFYRDFLENYAKDANGYRTYKDATTGKKIDLAKDVVDIDGNPKVLDLTELKSIDAKTADFETLENVFKNLFEQMEDRCMSFIKPVVRRKFFTGALPGLPKIVQPESNGWGNKPHKFLGNKNDYVNWQPNFGKAQRFLVDAHGHGGGNGGWEINFKAQNTYGEFEEMVAWFRESLSQVVRDPLTGKNKVQLFQAPGHQRIVFAKHPELDEGKLSEFYRMIQSYIVLNGIKGNSGIEFANYKRVQPEDNLKNLYHGGRGVIRPDDQWKPWVQNTGGYGIEFRAGTKNLAPARFYQTTLASRIAANDFSGIADIDDYKLNSFSFQKAQSIAERFGIEQDVVEQAINNLNKAGITDSYRVMYWGWTEPGVAFVGDTKREIIKNLVKDYTEKVALMDPNMDAATLKNEIREMNRTWVSASKLIDDLEAYMRPKDMDYNELTMDFKANVDAPNRVANPVDVNDIDLGIEYSGKFPLRLKSITSKERLEDGKRAWVQTVIDLSSEEREAIIKKVAQDLFEEIGGEEGEAPVKLDVDGHGHGLDVAYAIRDSKGRKWQVEWDGIGRSYTPEGEIIADSPRGGTIELITPKFVPNIEEVAGVYKAFEKNNVLPSLMAGGGHVNIDLAAFDGNPKALARFLTIFHEHRGIISLMFQHINRTHTSEQIEVSDTLKNALKDFNGSEEELKKLLYNERYFNTRFGRKTRYLQLDVSAYFQDVIPEEFVTDDFDISNPTVDWRRTFRVDPKIRKAEFRMFNAPRDAAESAMQIQLVRAMLDKAINSTEALSGEVDKTTHLDYVKKPSEVDEDLKKLCDDLGLDINQYRTAAMEGLSISQLESDKVFFRSIEEKMAIHPYQPGWGSAVEARSSENALNSTGREWTPGAADETNTMNNEHRIRAALAAQEMRQEIVPARELPGEFVRTNTCDELINEIL